MRSWNVGPARAPGLAFPACTGWNPEWDRKVTGTRATAAPRRSAHPGDEGRHAPRVGLVLGPERRPEQPLLGADADRGAGHEPRSGHDESQPVAEREVGRQELPQHGG